MDEEVVFTAATSSPPSSYTIHIVLTGASGFLGQHLLADWLKVDDDTTSSSTGNNTFGSGLMASIKGAAASVGTIGTENDIPSVKITALYQSLEGFPDAVELYTKRISSSSGRIPTVSVVSLDLTDAKAVEEFHSKMISSSSTESVMEGGGGGGGGGIETTKPTPQRKQRVVVVHTAALSSPRICEDDPNKARSINVPTHFFRTMREYPMIALSTDQVYNGTTRRRRGDSPTELVGNYYKEHELDGVGPVNIYGQTKLEMEHFLLNLYDGHTPEQRTISPTGPTPPPPPPPDPHRPALALLRSSIILGPTAPICTGAHPTFVNFCQSRGETRQNTSFFTNEYRNVVSVRHVVNVINDFIVHNLTMMMDDDRHVDGTLLPSSSSASSSPPPPRVFNMGGPNRVNRMEIARAVFDYFGYDPKYLIEELQTSSLSPLDISMDSSLLMESGFGGTHQPETLKELVEYSFQTTI